MRKALGAAGLLALLVLPLTGSAGATGKLPDKTLCATVKAATNVNAGANIGLFGTVLDHKLVPGSTNVQARVSGDVYVRICVKVDANVALALKGELGGAVQAAQCGTGEIGIVLRALADLQASLLAGGYVGVTVDVIVDAGLNEDNDEKKTPTRVVDTNKYLAEGASLVSFLLTDLTVCVGVEEEKK